MFEPQAIRKLFPVLSERSYMFSGGIAPVSAPYRSAVERYLNELATDPGEVYRRSRDEFDEVRGLFAELIGADIEEIVITDCTGTGSNIAIELADLKTNGNVVFDEFAYPSSAYPWMLPSRESVERRYVKMDGGVVRTEDIAEAIDDDTSMVSISHVSERTGFRYNLREIIDIAHQHGAVVAVDAMQSAGAMPIDVHRDDVDFLSCGAMKWLLGSPGLGFFYASKKHIENTPSRIGGISVMRDERSWPDRELKLKSGSEKFNVGYPNLIGIAATKPGLEMLVQAGKENIEKYILDLTGYCIDEVHSRNLELITPANREERAGIVSIRMDDCAEADQFLCERGIDAYHYLDILRIDPHIFNDKSDIDKFFTALDEYLSENR